ncbi:Meiotic recombination protein spo-11 [Nosema bombycis CQ1]|uniref:DNA topoisomerase (ATP-hydrolyzing) n=1 Tax=Nosema bombycis (strain CQ1 / CVCC 102059) TaxID=578461 RepID=R0MJ86_NOSB1|nr:Meiotic recombination protein spo-11 [Nosema bombycis CQ1]|eukprot:EOB14275.1 Meiotic recombination protein spo-11 [Nosema bombycis CQ1]
MNSNKILKNLKSLTLKALTTIRSKSVLKKLRFYEILFEMNSQGIIRNKREIFYLDVPIFGKQEVVDSLIKETCKELKEIPFGLNITNTLKGIYFGEVEFVLIKDDRVIFNDPLLKPQILNTLPFQPRTILIPDMNQVLEVTTSANFCLVVEKDTIFSRILRSKNLSDHVPFLLVCGKGYPCRNTLLFLSKLKIKKILGLFDYDPYGLDIFLNTKKFVRDLN